MGGAGNRGSGDILRIQLSLFAQEYAFAKAGGACCYGKYILFIYIHALARVDIQGRFPCCCSVGIYFHWLVLATRS